MKTSSEESAVDVNLVLDRLYTDKPAKDNTPRVTLERVVHTFESISASASLYAGMHGAGGRSSKFAADWAKKTREELIGFFADYKIEYPDPAGNGASVQGLEAVLNSHGQEALNAIEGVTRLVSKVVLNTYERADPHSYVHGVLRVLSGLPLQQLGSTPNKSQAEMDARTYRDRVSKLITFGRVTGTPLMLELFPEVLPKAAASIRACGIDAYGQALDNVLSYIAESYLSGRVPNLALVQAKISELEASITSQNQRLAPSQGGSRITPVSQKPTRQMIVQFLNSADPKATLEGYFGSPIVAVHFTSHRSGVNRQVGFYVDGHSSQPPEKHSVEFGSFQAPATIVNNLIAIAKACQTALKPSDPLYAVNSHAISNLPHFARR
ncbi:hypothetical protein HYY73_05355 [Candidatus Woesearchaeota archaeon]|nr:hypothetical protein [Candidatus Woesearchaeota archaeon]